MIIKIPYGRRYLRFPLPSARVLGILQNKIPFQKDIKTLITSSLNKNFTIKNGKHLLSGRKNVLVVVPDATRKAHLKDILPPVLKRIENQFSKVDIIVATGLHKKHSHEQLKHLLGGVVVKTHKILSHELNNKMLTHFGFTKNGIPIVLNKALKDYDLIISIGLIEPHLYAGYSGGAKTIAIGLAGEATINATHSIGFLSNPKTAIGVIRGNPFQEVLRQIAGKVPVEFCINLVNSSDGGLLKVFSGSPGNVFKEGVNFSKTVSEIAVDRAADIVICGVGYPKDVNLYQASRAINYVLNVDRPVLRKGGVLILVAELKDGIGEGISEKRFYRELRNMPSPETFIKNIRRTGCIAGVHRAYMVARPLVDYNILIVNEGPKRFLEGLPIPMFDNIQDALARAYDIAGKRSRIYIIPRALSTIARRR